MTTINTKLAKLFTALIISAAALSFTADASDARGMGGGMRNFGSGKSFNAPARNIGGGEMRNFGGGYRTFGGKASGRTFDRHDFRGVVGPSRIRIRDPKVPVRDHRNGGYGQGGVSVRDAAQPRYCGKIANNDPRCQPSPRDHRASNHRR